MSLADEFLPVVAQTGRTDAPAALDLALEQSHEVKAKVETCADGLATANEITKEKIAAGTTAMSAHQTLLAGTTVESKVQEYRAMPAKHDPTENHLLAALGSEQRERIFPHLESVDLRLGEVLYESGGTLSHVYFPTDCIVSLLYVTIDGASAEIAVAGDEGLIGVSLFMGGETTTNRAVVQSAGHAYRLISRRLTDEFDRHGKVQALFLRYTQALITQMAQTAVCNRHHTLDQQFCRWLLLSLDRLPTKTLEMTQQLIANMLGVRREGVTVVAGKLRRLGVIHFSRGHITVLDRPHLERLCCECYSVVKKEEDRLLAGLPPRIGRARV